MYLNLINFIVNATKKYDISEWVVGIALTGAIAGSLLGGALSNKFVEGGVRQLATFFLCLMPL